MSESNGRSKSGIRLRKQIPTREQLAVREGVVISITQAFCPRGHALIRPENARFQGQPGIELRVGQQGVTSNVTLSPIHGNHERVGEADFAYGHRCTVACPLCDTELPEHDHTCSCGRGHMRLLYLTTWLEQGDVAMVCDVWGCQRSRVLDKFELLSEWVDEDDDEGGGDGGRPAGANGDRG